jgi:hypothetical protein
MPFKSKAQRRKFAELLVTGKISDETYEEWNRSTGKANLPEPSSRRPRRNPRRNASPSGGEKQNESVKPGRHG